MAGKLDRLKGAVKEAYGKITGDKRIEAEGKADKMKGKAKEAVEDTKDAAKGVSDSLKD